MFAVIGKKTDAMQFDFKAILEAAGSVMANMHAVCQGLHSYALNFVSATIVSPTGPSGAVEGSKLSGGSYDNSMNKPAAGAAPATPAACAPPGGYTVAEVAKHAAKAECWVVVNG